MRVYLDKDVVQKETGWQFEGFIADCIYQYIREKGATDILLSPDDYLSVFFSYKGNKNEGRTEEDRPWFSIAGIKFIMLSPEDVDKYKVLT
jgi:hypothetical protein